MSQLLMKNFDEFFMPAIYEGISQNVEVFNAASLGAITLTTDAIIGSFKHTSFFASLESAARDIDQFKATNPAVAPVDLSQKQHTEVKFKEGFGPIRWEPGQLTWLLKPTGEGIAIASAQFAEIMLKRAVNKAIGASVAAISNNPAATHDVSATDGINQSVLNDSHALFGDASMNLVVQVMDGKTAHQLIGQNLDNQSNLFAAGNVRIVDILGKRSIITDAPALRSTGKNSVLTLAYDAARVHSQGDLKTLIWEAGGNERIEAFYQTEYTSSMSIRGYSWDEAGGGKSPVQAGLETGANWELIADSVKHTAGVIATGDSAKD